MNETNDKYFEKLMTDREFRVELMLAENALRLAMRISELREAAGLSQAELAAKVGTKQSQISRFENGDYSRFSVSSLAKIADALQCELKVELLEPVRKAKDMTKQALKAPKMAHSKKQSKASALKAGRRKSTQK